MKCTYCGKDYEPPRGITIVTTDGRLLHFCSSKCRKNKKMKRRTVRWTKKAHDKKNKK